MFIVEDLVSLRCYSFFDRSNITIQDAMVFIKSYLDKMTLLQCSIFSGISYRSTAVNWASFLRELFKEHFFIHTRHRVLSGEVEIDESLFGRKMKYHRGNPRPGLRVWIFGMVERQSNTVILYPVGDRTKDTLIPLIKRHVAPGSTIYSDGWSAYCDLNSIGYQHFTVLHKYSFKKVYINQATDERVVCHTNEIEGAWKHAKEHFKRMSGTQLTKFEGHLAEVMWRSEVKGRMYVSFFDLLRSVYTLQGPPDYHYTTPLFDSWTMESDAATPIAEWKIVPADSNAESEEVSSQSSQSDNEPEPIVVSSDDSYIRPNQSLGSPSIVYRTSVASNIITESDIAAMFSGSLSEDEADDTLVEHPPTPLPPQSPPPSTPLPPQSPPPPTTPVTVTTRRSTRKSNKESRSKCTTSTSEAKQPQPSTSAAASSVDSVSSKGRSKSGKKNQSEKVCHPKGYVEEKQDTPRRTKKRPPRRYSKSDFVWEFSSDDDDFV